MISEKDIAKEEWLEDRKDEDIIRLRDQIDVLKRHQSDMETLIRHIGIELQEIRRRMKD